MVERIASCWFSKSRARPIASETLSQPPARLFTEMTAAAGMIDVPWPQQVLLALELGKPVASIEHTEHQSRRDHECRNGSRRCQ